MKKMTPFFTQKKEYFVLQYDYNPELKKNITYI